MADFGIPSIKNSAESVLILTAFKNALDLFRKELNIVDPESPRSLELVESVVERLEKITEMSENYLFSAKDFKNYWEMTYQALMQYVYKLENNLILSDEDLSNLLRLLDRVVEFLLSNAHAEYLKSIKNKIDIIVMDIEKGSKKVEADIERYMRLRNIADTALTENIYALAVTRYRELETKYRTLFFGTIALLVVISIYLISLNLPSIQFWTFKATLLILGATLITYFLKQSYHYQHLADQSYQIQIELQAFPSYMESVQPEDTANMRKELASKYFGRELDRGGSSKDISNILTDQMKATADLAKAATDLAKTARKNID